MTRQAGMVGVKNVLDRNTFLCTVTASFVLEVRRNTFHLLYLKGSRMRPKCVVNDLTAGSTIQVAGSPGISAAGHERQPSLTGRPGSKSKRNLGSCLFWEGRALGLRGPTAFCATAPSQRAPRTGECEAINAVSGFSGMREGARRSKGQTALALGVDFWAIE
jgi:hypothetical protein